MQIGVIGDLHLNSRAPERRLDSDYLDTVLGKLKQSLDILSDCDVVIQVGDFFDTPTVSNYTIARAIELLKDFNRPLLVVVGQHDITGHSMGTLKNSPIHILSQSGCVQILDKDSVCIDDVNFYGASFGQEVPTCDRDYNVLVTHRMVGNRPLFPGQELESPRVFLRNYLGYNFVAVGDYHYRFDDQYKGRFIVNPGAVVRKTLSDVENKHEPAVAIFDTEDHQLVYHKLSVASVESTFDLVRKDSRDKIDMSEFIKTFSERGSSNVVGWKSILANVMDERKCSKDTKHLIDDVMNTVCS